MPQNPIAVSNVLNPKAKPVLNITVATVVKATPGNLLSLTVVVAGSATGTINDCATTGAATAANTVAVLPDSVGPVPLPAVGLACATGIVVTPGTGQTIAVTYQ